MGRLLPFAGKSVVPLTTSSLQTLLSSDEFVADGVVCTGLGRIKLIAVDPERHRLCVWGGQAGRTYGRTAQALKATVFTNGPYMGRYSRSRVAGRFLSGSLIGLAVTVTLDTVARPGQRTGVPGRFAAGLLGITAGIRVAWRMTLTDWIPCGAVLSASAGIEDRRDYGDEGRTHAWIGRRGASFGDYAVGLGNPPDDLLEGMGGLVPLIRAGRCFSADPTSDVFHPDYARVTGKRTVVSWGLVPVPTLSGGGVLIIAATTRVGDSARIGTVLAALGARDAVATDTSACALVGLGDHFIVGPPPRHRQAIQSYGLCCLPAARATDRLP